MGTGGTARAAVFMVMMMVMSACGTSSPELATDSKRSIATTGTTVDLFATTAPPMEVVDPVEATTTTEATTTEVPNETSTTTNGANRSRSGDPSTPQVSVPAEFGESGLLWIGTWLGYGEDLSDVRFVLAPDGSVLRISEDSIYSGAGSYLTWNIGPAGYMAVVDKIEELGIRTDRYDWTELGQSGEIRTDGTYGVLIENLNAGPGELAADQVAVRRGFRELMVLLDDMSWLDGITTVTPRAPWVPDRLAINVRNEYNPVYYSTEPFVWPLDSFVSDFPGDEVDEHWVCLDGAEAEVAWNTFMIDGVNNARLPLDINGNLWEGGVRVSHPMYPGISPCPGATGFGTGSNERVNSTDVTELFLTAEDMGGEWSVTQPVISPPPPNVENCSPITDAEVAVDQFDSWLSHRIDLQLMGIAGQFQMLGEVPAGVDAETVIRQVGTMSCLDGLAQFGVTRIDSGMVDNPPDGVTVAAYWELTSDGVHQIVVDALLDNGVVMAYGMTSDVPLGLDILEPYLARAAAKAAAG